MMTGKKQVCVHATKSPFFGHYYSFCVMPSTLHHPLVKGYHHSEALYQVQTRNVLGFHHPVLDPVYTPHCGRRYLK